MEEMNPWPRLQVWLRKQGVWVLYLDCPCLYIYHHLMPTATPTGWSFPSSMSQSLRGAHNPFWQKSLWVDSVSPSFQATHVCLDRAVRVGWSKNSPSWYLEPLSSQTLRLHHWVWQVMQGFSSFEVNDLQEILQVLLQLTFCWVPLPHQLFWHNPNIWALLPRRLLNSHIIQRIKLETRQFQS